MSDSMDVTGSVKIDGISETLADFDRLQQAIAGLNGNPYVGSSNSLPSGAPSNAPIPPSPYQQQGTDRYFEPMGGPPVYPLSSIPNPVPVNFLPPGHLSADPNGTLPPRSSGGGQGPTSIYAQALSIYAQTVTLIAQNVNAGQGGSVNTGSSAPSMALGSTAADILNRLPYRGLQVSFRSLQL